MTKSIRPTTNPLPAVLLDKQKENWQALVEQYPELTQDFLAQTSSDVVDDFKTAITLSDFIMRSAQQSPKRIFNMFSEKRPYHLEQFEYLSDLQQILTNVTSEEACHQALRLYRMEHMVCLAFADLVLSIPLDLSLAKLSELADALILGALEWLSTYCYQKWGKPVNASGELQPLLVYGMGKLGGKELNFSSDIDLIFVYPETGETVDGPRCLDNHTFFTRLAQKLITALNQKNADGFVYRVDMRLRPFGDSGPLVLSFNAMEDYYQEQGRDWERYAMLKARLIGEGKYHGTLSSLLRPFVYRRYIDFSVIDSLRRMKMMIAQEVRRKGLINNIKLGAGGIREIEFIVQVFQLIRGGRTKELQQRNLLKVLPLLVEHQAIDEHNKNVLETAYRFLRRVENIIQAIDDKQTQTLPDCALDQARLLHVLAGQEVTTWPQFITYLDKVMAAVHQEFIALIGEEMPHHQTEPAHWVALWESDWDLAESEQWIASEQVDWDATKISVLLTDFKQETNKRSVGNRGRLVLGKLMPLLLSQIADLGADHICLERTLWILSKIVTRTAYIELLYENEGALKHLVKLCQASSWVAEHIAKYPIILDELIDPHLLHNPPSLTSYADDLRQHLLRVPEDDLEAQMECLRQFKQAQQLRIAAADIVGVLPITKVSDHLTALAEAIIKEVVQMAWSQMAQRFGIPASLPAEQTGFAVIGYGKMGGIELSYSSDLDLVFVHRCDINDLTNGEKQVSAGQFYAKLAQRIMHIFNTRMASGLLYELDMRLRPSGNSGVLVVSLPTFAQYQAEDAWTWEHQALVRARVVYGQPEISKAFDDIRCAVLSKARDKLTLKADVLAMRQKMRDHLDKSTDSAVDIKQGKGGLVDVEFLAQFLVLANANKFSDVARYSDNIRIFKTLCDLGVVSKEDKQTLIANYCALRDIGHKQSLQKQPGLLDQEKFANYATQLTPIIGKYLS